MRGGHSLTPFALGAIASVGPVRRPLSPGWLRAVAFIDASLDDESALGRPGLATDYPVYATALAVRAWATAGRPVPSKTARWLASRQLLAGWEGHAAHGGFDMGHRTVPTPPDSGHVDLSMTRRSLEALRLVGHRPADASMTAGAAFVSRCAAAEGGFVYSPVDPVVNKAGWIAEGGCAGYGSATADGILALTAAAPSHALGPALGFLRTHHAVDRNPGLEDGPMAAFGPAMRGYYRAAAAEVFGRFGGPAGWREELVSAVLDEQRADGTWANESPLQKEDEPVVATGFAVAALAHASRP